MNGDTVPMLTLEEQRVLGCLIEKERTTPDQYPLTLNSLRLACNQSSSRHPVVAYDDFTVQRALDSLRERGMTRIVHSVHNRATKYRHVADEALRLGEQELALISVLLLRGPQTAAELRTRTERLVRFDSVDEVERVLDRLASRDEPLVTRLARQPGQKETRVAQLLGGPVEAASAPPRPRVAHVAPDSAHTPGPDGIAALRDELRALAERVAALEDLLGGELTPPAI